jgi:hypothetical protein
MKFIDKTFFMHAMRNRISCFFFIIKSVREEQANIKREKAYFKQWIEAYHANSS